MKILFVSPVGAMFSGAEVAIVHLMNYLVNQGHDIYNVIPNNAPYSDMEYIKRMEESGIHFIELETRQWWWRDSDKKDFLEIENQAFQQKNIAQIRKIIRDEKIDLVISNTVNVFQGALAASCENIRHFYIIHEFPFGEFGYYKKLIPLVNDLSDKIFVVQGELYKTLSHYFPSEKLIPFIPFTEVTSDSLTKSKEHRFVTVGGINDRKNQLEVLKAYHLLNELETELVFIGGWDIEYKKLLDDYIEKYNLRHVSFLGYQSNPWEFVTDKDILVLPAKMEAFPLVFVESILNGVPTIVSDNLGYQSTQRYFNQGISYTLHDVHALADKMQETLSKYETIKQEWLSKKSIAFSKYSADALFECFVKEIEVNSVKKENVSGLLYDFLGLDLPKRTLDFITNSQVIISTSYEGLYSTYSEKILMPMKHQGKLNISIDSEKSLKITLGKTAGAFKNIFLKDVESDQIVPISATNGRDYEGILHFVDKHPHILYDISELSHTHLEFDYECVTSTDSEKEFIELREQRDQIQSELNAVINSRRWTIPTKILKFLRLRK